MIDVKQILSTRRIAHLQQEVITPELQDVFNHPVRQSDNATVIAGRPVPEKLEVVKLHFRLA